MVQRIPRPEDFVPLNDLELSLIETTPAGQEALSTCPLEELRIPRIFPTERRGHSSTGDSMVNTTFNNEGTIPQWTTFSVPPHVTNQIDDLYPLGLFIMHLKIGSSLNGHPHKLHGGALSMILDEAMGRASRHHCSDDTIAFTATMTVDYKATVSTPGVLAVKSWLEGRSDGRKHWVKAEVIQNGKVVAGGSCLFLEVAKPKEYYKLANL